MPTAELEKKHMTESAIRRRPRRPRWQNEGQDPDYRFSLANERTYLAWIRTSLALVAASVALAQLVPALGPPLLRSTLAALLAVLALGVAALAYWRWAGNERAMRQEQPLPHTPALVLLSATLGTAATVVLLVVALP